MFVNWDRGSYYNDVLCFNMQQLVQMHVNGKQAFSKQIKGKVRILETNNIKMELNVLMLGGYRDSKQLMGLAHCQARNNEAISLAFNASWSISPGLMHARKGTVFPSSPLKPYCTMLLMLDKFNSMSAKHTNRRLNNTDFKELLFYGVRNAG